MVPSVTIFVSFLYFISALVFSPLKLVKSVRVTLRSDHLVSLSESRPVVEMPTDIKHEHHVTVDPMTGLLQVFCLPLLSLSLSLSHETYFRLSV